MRKAIMVMKRELVEYFWSPVAYIFAIIMLILFGFTTFTTFGNNLDLFTANQADLNSFFQWHPRIFVVMIPAMCMHVWSDERRLGTFELLMTFPVKLRHLVIGKFFASWFFLGFCLLCTFPMVLVVGYLGSPDYGVIISGYIGSFLMAGIYIAITTMTSALARKQVTSFVLALIISLLLSLFGEPAITDTLKAFCGPIIFNMLSSLSIYSHFETIRQGVLDFRDIFYFFSMISMFLILTRVTLFSYRSGR